MPRLLLAAPFLLVLHAAAQVPEDSRPSLFFREDWKEIAAVAPVTQEHVANPALLLGLYGPGKDGVRKSHHDTPKDDPYYIWLGSCPSSCAIALRRKDAFVDLTGLAKVRWRTKQTGFRSVRLTLKLANGMWLVSDYAEGPTVDWHESEFAIAGIRWRRMNIETIVEGAWVASAHGAGLMVLPVLLGSRPSLEAASDTPGHTHLSTGVRPLAGLLATGVHTVGYLAVTGAVAWVVYRKLGLALLRSAWLNLDVVWAAALVITGLATLVM